MVNPEYMGEMCQYPLMYVELFDDRKYLPKVDQRDLVASPSIGNLQYIHFRRTKLLNLGVKKVVVHFHQLLTQLLQTFQVFLGKQHTQKGNPAKLQCLLHRKNYRNPRIHIFRHPTREFH